MPTGKASLEEMLRIAEHWMDEFPTTEGPAEDFIRDFAERVEEMLDKQSDLINQIEDLHDKMRDMRS